MQIKILGSGDSKGAPRIGCACFVCSGQKIKNVRNRTSLLISSKNKNYLIDTSSEIRSALIKQKVKKIDYLLISHSHSDHILGFEDIIQSNRLLNKEKYHLLDIYLTNESLKDIRKRFYYLFSKKSYYFTEPLTQYHIIKDNKKYKVGNLSVMPVKMLHNKDIEFKSFVITDDKKKLVYVPDIVNKINFLKQEIFKNANLLIIGADKKNPKDKRHNIIDLNQTIKIVKQLKPKKCVLIHMSHRIDFYNPPKLPSFIKLGYDGMAIEM